MELTITGSKIRENQGKSSLLILLLIAGIQT